MILVDRIQIPALPTKKPRRLYVYLPRDYEQSEQRYPVCYMFDGHNIFYNSHATYGKSWGMKQYLERSRQQMIVVAVECNHEGFRRISEYSPFDFRAPKPISDVKGQGQITMDWLTTELKPEIDAAFRTLPDREHTMIAGSSMGGLMALYATVAYNAYFSRGAALSPSLWVDPKGVKALIRSHPLMKPTRIYLDVGTREREGRIGPLAFLFETAKRLTRAGAEVSANVIPGAEHNEAAWEKRIPQFMHYLKW